MYSLSDAPDSKVLNVPLPFIDLKRNLFNLENFVSSVESGMSDVERPRYYIP